MKLFRSFAVVGLILWAGNSLAFGPVDALKGNVSGTAEESLVKGAAKKGLQAAINDKLKKANCVFSNDTTDKEVKCQSGNLDSVIKEITNWRAGLENSVAHDVDVYITAKGKDSTLANKRANFAQDKIKSKIGYWDYYVSGLKGDGNGLALRIEID